MQTRKNSLPLILAIIAIVLLIGLVGVAFLGAGALAYLMPVRANVTPAVEEVVVEEIETPDLPLIPLSDLKVEIGVGSPIPVDVVVAGQWPHLCAQLAQVDSRLSGQDINIQLQATVEPENCPPDQLGLPFSLRIPLNMVEMQPGSYLVKVNSLQTSFDWPPANPPQSNEPAPVRMVYIGLDGNLWLLDTPTNAPRQLTQDGTSLETYSVPNIAYSEPRLSSDGRFVAVERSRGEAHGDGLLFTFGLWIYDLASGERWEAYSGNPAGFNWQPGSHLLAYSPELNEQYFNHRAEKPNADYATDIQGYEVETRTTRQLVQPERGYALVNPVWSPDGRFLSFDEVKYYEGRGPFAYYDFANGAYIAWEQPLGLYAWAPDGEALAYDNLTYTATGAESIFIRNRQSGSVSSFSKDFEPGYAIQPVFSPQGDRIAYLVNLSGPDTQQFTLFVQPLSPGAAKELGTFEIVSLMSWSADGTALIFSSGPYNAQTIYRVNVATGEVQELQKGQQPSVSIVP